MNVGDALQFFHRSDGQPVRDSTGMPIRVPPDGVSMPAKVVAVINDSTVNLTATDADGKTFSEWYVYVLQDDEVLPRGGRYALQAGDAQAKHRRPSQFGK
jgi:hypothetical protein